MTASKKPLQDKQDDIYKESSQDQEIDLLKAMHIEFTDADIQNKIKLLINIMARNKITIDDLLDMVDE